MSQNLQFFLRRKHPPLLKRAKKRRLLDLDMMRIAKKKIKIHILRKIRPEGVSEVQKMGVGAFQEPRETSHQKSEENQQRKDQTAINRYQNPPEAPIKQAGSNQHQNRSWGGNPPTKETPPGQGGLQERRESPQANNSPPTRSPPPPRTYLLLRGGLHARGRLLWTIRLAGRGPTRSFRGSDSRMS